MGPRTLCSCRHLSRSLKPNPERLKPHCCRSEARIRDAPSFVARLQVIRALPMTQRRLKEMARLLSVLSTPPSSPSRNSLDVPMPYPDVDLELASDHLRKPCPNDICSKLSLCYSQLSLCSMLQLLQSSRRSSQQHGSASCAGYFLSMSAERLALNFTPANPKTMTTPPAQPGASFSGSKNGLGCD